MTNAATPKPSPERLGIPFHEIELDPGEMVDFFPELNFWRDDPIADIAGFGYFAVMRKGARARAQGHAPGPGRRRIVLGL